ncbi:hypothetical protein M5K25_009544 [Dendrobium thyrsiflorum]|uniref:Uncharacterized protein n=1 Tax=Dendrobium thyrsiflorum TaxID=117978 RepID=A0ABD0V715_DENTH
MASSDKSPRRSITSMFGHRKNLSTGPPGSRLRGQGQGQIGQEHTYPPVVGVPPHPRYFSTPTSTSPRFPSPDQTHSAPFYPYNPPPTSQTIPLTYPYPPYYHSYYYPPPAQPEQCGPSIQAKVGARSLQQHRIRIYT